MRDIGKNIKTLRIQKNLTQDALAERLFVTRQTVSNYETGKSRPDIDMLMKIAEVLGEDIHVLLYGPAPKTDRSDALRALAIGSVATALLCLLSFGFKDWAYRMYYEFLPAPMYIHTILLQPLFYLFLGWTLMQGIGILLKAKPLTFPSVRYLRWGILVFLALCLLLLLPLLGWTVVDTLRYLQIRGTQASYTSSYDFWPVWKEAALGLSFALMEYPAAATVFGALLWLCGFPGKRTT